MRSLGARRGVRLRWPRDPAVAPSRAETEYWHSPAPARLSKFCARRDLGALLLLPGARRAPSLSTPGDQHGPFPDADGWRETPPACVSPLEPRFGLRLQPHPAAAAYALLTYVPGFPLRCSSDQHPRVLRRLVLVDSAHNAPTATPSRRALPNERRFRGIGQVCRHRVRGSPRLGRWLALFYPDEYNGAWVASPTRSTSAPTRW